MRDAAGGFTPGPLSLRNAGRWRAAPAYKTIEVVYRMAKDGWRLLFVSGIASRFVAFDPASGNPKRLYFDGAAATRHISWSLDTTALCSAAATYSGNSVSAMYFDSVARLGCCSPHRAERR